MLMWHSVREMVNHANPPPPNRSKDEGKWQNQEQDSNRDCFKVKFPLFILFLLLLQTYPRAVLSPSQT